MIGKKLEEISEEDLLLLIKDEIAEARTIDYKRELPGDQDGDKKEFLADLSSFANAGGGDLILGIDESKGIPTQIIGIGAQDPDLEIRRLDSIAASGLSPRIRYALRVISCQDDRRVLVVRIERSWNGPHRVIFKGHDKFYGRNSAGKYPLDVDELRAAFTLSAAAAERIRAFRVDRIIALSNNETPVPFVPGSKIVLHCIPVESFATETYHDVLPFYQNVTRLRPIGTWSYARRLNLDGVVSFAAGSPSRSYTQLYRTGVIEVVDGATLNSGAGQQGRRAIPSIYFEKLLLEYFPLCFEIFQSLGVGAPVVVALTLTDVRGFAMGIDDFFVGGGDGVDRDTLMLPETIVADFSTSPSTILKPLFDLIWNACGFPASRNFDADGNWNARG